MHKALSTNDIVHEILQYLSKNSLTAVAVTCKSLSGPALSTLWKEITSLEPLRQLLSTDHLERGPDDPQAVESWTRFKTCTARIRVFSLKDPATPEQLDFVRTLMAQYLPTDPVLPSLRTLRVIESEVDGGLALCTTLLAHPGLRTVELKSPSSRTAAAVLQHLRLRAPDVQRLVVTGASFLLPLLSRFAHLQSLIYNNTQGHVDQRALLALAKLPRLRQLTITGIFTSDSFDAATNASGEPLFPVLDYLVVMQASNIGALSAMLSLVKRSLSFLIVGCILPHPYDPKDNHTQIRTLSQAISSCEQLRSLSLYLLNGQRVRVREDCLQPLRKLQHLDSVNFRDVLITPTNQQSHADLAAIRLITHWHNIRVVHLDSTLWRQGGGTPYTLKILPMFAEHCPKMTEVHVAISVKGVPARDKAHYARIRRTMPLRLFLCGEQSSFSANSDTLAVAEYICDVYPCIEINFRETEGQQQPKWQEKWRRVNGAVKRIAAAREQGRAEAMAEKLAAEGKESE
ncbi:hypothetical protein PsYK624_105130 [Phanerochaete sordida]|uniref:F-box domain-containing protein n=1 Tax=Phanerochaete sordida TaxID=48140 RepID=A0A9P3LH56_9APHY|nr:hypothetical protein PsYK624_105130 [Phanerochaete sordida]